MLTNKFGEIVLSENDIFDSIMRGIDVCNLQNIVVDTTVDTGSLKALVPDMHMAWRHESDTTLAVEEFDQQQQAQWHMPKHYQDLDIAKYVLDLCTDGAELQRVGQELLMYQERNLMDLLRYLVYLVDTMRANNIIWGVGRGSSVASFVLYKLGVHRVNSLYYDLDPAQFLR